VKFWVPEIYLVHTLSDVHEKFAVFDGAIVFQNRAKVGEILPEN